MSRMRAAKMLLPITRAVGQLDDVAFRGVLVRSLGWSLACVVALHVATIWTIDRFLDSTGWLGWAADILGFVGASLLAFWLFLPVAAGIGTLYVDSIAAAVERRFYPWLQIPQSASIGEQTWDGVAVAMRVLGLNLAALVLALVIPGLGLVLGWGITAFAIGRGLFVAVAMRRMSLGEAVTLYRSQRLVVFVQGAILAVLTYIPLLNLFIPIIGIAAMVHVVDMTLERPRRINP
jgi:CysZ protein